MIRHCVYIFILLFFLLLSFAGKFACQVFENLRREAASIKVQKNLRRHLSRKSYKRMQLSALTLQTGSRILAARNEFRFKKQTKAAKILQVITFPCFSSLNRLDNCLNNVLRFDWLFTGFLAMSLSIFIL